MIRGRARLPFLAALLVLGIVLGLTVNTYFFVLAYVSAVIMVQLASGRNQWKRRADQASVTDWLRSRRARRRHGSKALRRCAERGKSAQTERIFHRMWRWRCKRGKPEGRAQVFHGMLASGPLEGTREHVRPFRSFVSINAR